MKRLKWLLLLSFIYSSVLIAQVSNGNYAKEIKKERKAKNIEFKEAGKSPLSLEKRKQFKGLNYFKPDQAYQITAKLIKEDVPDTILMKTTTERLPVYVVYAKAYFTIDNANFSLTVYRNVGLMNKPGYEDYLFIPFTDETNGEETYGGGRYIDARITPGDSILIDFNCAYNPYCVYSKKYSCPIPPSENYIKARIVAGEKNYH